MTQISKSLRFEILRRDDFSCRYCGSKAGPDTPLHVDHVVPTALGGSNEPNNLCASCADCNMGKGSTQPEAATVEQVDAKHLAWRGAVAQAAQELQAIDPETERAITGMQENFGKWFTIGPGERDAIAKYIGQGLPADVMIEAALIARTHRNVEPDGMFAYSIGVCRKKLAQIHERAREIVADAEVTP